MSTFQLTHWVALADRFDQLRFRRALTAMSVVPVDRQWLSDACGLSRQETRALLQALRLADALVVLPAMIGRTSPTPTGSVRWPWARLRNCSKLNPPVVAAVNDFNMATMAPDGMPA